MLNGCRVEEVICKDVGQGFFCEVVDDIRGANVLLLFDIIAEKWEVEVEEEVVEEEIGVLVLCWCVFAGGDMRNGFVEIDDDELGVDVWPIRRFWWSSLSIGSDLTLSVSIDVVLSNWWYCVNRSSFVTVVISSNVSVL